MARLGLGGGEERQEARIITKMIWPLSLKTSCEGEFFLVLVSLVFRALGAATDGSVPGNFLAIAGTVDV